jgi:hypothetical protein
MLAGVAAGLSYIFVNNILAFVLCLTIQLSGAYPELLT